MNLEKIKTLALQIASSSEGVGANKNYRLGAVLFDRKKRILSAECNSYKTHPSVLRFSPYPNLHAEMNCLIHNGLDNSEDCELMVVRLRRDNSLGMAKPCKACEDALKYSRLKLVYYSSESGSINRYYLNGS